MGRSGHHQSGDASAPRRDFLRDLGRGLGTSAALIAAVMGCSDESAERSGTKRPSPLRLGLSTSYSLRWDLDRLIRNCEKIALHGVELGVNQAHGVGPAMSRLARRTFRRLFDESRVQFLGLHVREPLLAEDPSERRAAADRLAILLELSAELGGSGVRVTPADGSMADVETLEDWRDETLRPIVEVARSSGQELRWDWPPPKGGGDDDGLALHAELSAGASSNFRVAWNCRAGHRGLDRLRASFDRLAPHSGALSILHEIDAEQFPYREFASWCREIDYSGWLMMTLPSEVASPVESLIEQRKRWRTLTGERA